MIVFVPRSKRGTGVTASTLPTTLTAPVSSPPTAKVTVPGLLTVVAGVIRAVGITDLVGERVGADVTLFRRVIECAGGRVEIGDRSMHGLRQQ